MRDFDYYITVARQAENKSVGLWAAMNGVVRSVLETQQMCGKSLDEVADILEGIAGRPSKRQPLAINNIRVAARQIRNREDLVLT